MARGQRTERRPVNAIASLPRERVLVVIDQTPLREATGAECAAAMAQLEEARAAWHRFDREDKPAFVRWRAREFGPLLSELRDLELQIRDRETLVHEVEMEMRRGFFDPHSAYERVLSRRANPTSAPLEPEDQQPRSRTREAAPDRNLSEFEQEALFQEWVQRFIGTNPDKLDDEAYTTTFEAFKTHMFQPRAPEAARPKNSRRAESAARAQVEEETAILPLDARVKELYRLLVRRLHPDLRADGNAVASALWHDVQEAYAATDIAHLEILLALSDIEADRFSEQTSVAQMQAVRAELARALFALEDSLRQARDDDAWNFARAGAGTALRANVERELQAALRMRAERLRVLEQTIAAWSRPPAPNRAVQLPPRARIGRAGQGRAP